MLPVEGSHFIYVTELIVCMALQLKAGLRNRQANTLDAQALRPRAVLTKISTKIRLTYADICSRPQLNIELSQSASGDAIRRTLQKRVYGIPTHRAISVLTLPANPADYLRGRSRQALRTNVTNASKMGLRTRLVEASEFSATVTRLINAKAPILYLDLIASEPAALGMEHWIGENESGEVIGLARILVDQHAAYLKFFGAVRDTQESLIRWKLSADIFQHLAARNIKYVLAGPALGLDANLAYFQSRLGFAVMRASLAQSSRTLSGLFRKADRLANVG